MPPPGQLRIIVPYSIMFTVFKDHIANAKFDCNDELSYYAYLSCIMKAYVYMYNDRDADYDAMRCGANYSATRRDNCWLRCYAMLILWCWNGLR